MKKTKFAGAAVILAATLLINIPAAAVAPTFSDLKAGEWYNEYLDYIGTLEKLEIINGYGDGTFRPDKAVTCGEFIKMLAVSSELYTVTPDTGVHWAQPYWNMLNEAGMLEGSDIACSKEAFDKPISRYETAMLVNNTLYNLFCENPVKLDLPERNIGDHAVLNAAYRAPVEQVYGKGIITGYEDGSFRGDETLTRVQSVAVLVRLLWGTERKIVSFSEEQKAPEAKDLDFEPFAVKYRSMSVEERRVALFGNPNKTYFTGPGDAGAYIENVTVPIWQLHNGVKVSSTAVLQVHKLVAREVKMIFEEIYNDPEQFPINSVSGARYSDTMRHAWGCAIDMNPNENYYVQYSTGYQVGSYWRPNSDPFSIT
ncbi:MAG: S-layer homology domain-containing protein, partial [Oscillospiraceae bacterium]|nr:S-layer homology domain-containing protein [Oscillospiraceae bacterium]